MEQVLSAEQAVQLVKLQAKHCSLLVASEKVVWQVWQTLGLEQVMQLAIEQFTTQVVELKKYPESQAEQPEAEQLAQLAGQEEQLTACPPSEKLPMEQPVQRLPTR
jgi:hypothetical protein